MITLCVSINDAVFYTYMNFNDSHTFLYELIVSLTNYSIEKLHHDH